LERFSNGGGVDTCENAVRVGQQFITDDDKRVDRRYIPLLSIFSAAARRELHKTTTDVVPSPASIS
jgi:hypothetical protein